MSVFSNFWLFAVNLFVELPLQASELDITVSDASTQGRIGYA